MNLIADVSKAYGRVVGWLNLAAPLFDLGVRLYVADVFFRSGLVKLQSWDATLFLFEDEFAVPLLPPEIAAYLGTAAELTLPVFIALGFGTRLFALALALFNVMAVISYPGLSPAGLKDHILWGTLLLVILFHGPGKLALDDWLCRWRARGAR
ncbi:DoxX family protein [Undibacterium arcticum]|uniref:DoxX family protein n=1 Tax=Undibacterium arcticum TaxID=1762892 RepID=A0ABV7F0P8_9BURK